MMRDIGNAPGEITQLGATEHSLPVLELFVAKTRIVFDNIWDHIAGYYSKQK